MTTPAPEPVEVAAEELAAAERWARRYAAKPEKERHREVGALMAEYDRRGNVIAELNRYANEGSALLADLVAERDRDRADLARALPVVEAAGVLVERVNADRQSFCSGPVLEALVALARAVRAGMEQP